MSQTGGVNQQVAAFAFRPDDQITPTAETRFRSETAEVDILSNRRRKGINADVHIVLLVAPIEPVGQATSAINARRVSVSFSG